jgi:hypothetical protein
MASLNSMKKTELVKRCQELTHELKKLKKEKVKVETTYQENVEGGRLTAISAYQKGNKIVTVELAFDPEKGNAIVKKITEYDTKHMANYRLLEQLNMDILNQKLED